MASSIVSATPVAAVRAASAAARSCRYRRRDGRPCAATSIFGQNYCWAHRPHPRKPARNIPVLDLSLCDFGLSGPVPPAIAAAIAAARPAGRFNFTILLHGRIENAGTTASAAIQSAMLLWKPPVFNQRTDKYCVFNENE